MENTETVLYSQSKYIIREYEKTLQNKDRDTSIEFIARYNAFYQAVKEYLISNQETTGRIYLEALPEFKPVKYYRGFNLMRLIRQILFGPDIFNDLEDNKTDALNSLRNYIHYIGKS